MAASLAAFLVPGAVSAQTLPPEPDLGAAGHRPSPRSGGPAVASASPTYATVDSLNEALRAREAFDAAVALAAARPDDGGAYWRAARATVVMGLLEPTAREQNPWYDQAIVHAERAVALEPDNQDALYWLAAAKGRRALWASALHAADLAQEVYELAHRLLAADPRHAGALNVLGKLNHEVMSLSRVRRLAGRALLGHEALRTASWEDAVRYHEQAAALDPDMILYRLELGETYLRRGREAEARAAFEAVLALPVRYPPDPLLQERARALLSELPADGSAGDPQP